MSKGIEAPKGVDALFGTQATPAPSEPEPENVTPEVQPFQKLIDAIDIYNQSGLVKEDLQDRCSALVSWLEQQGPAAMDNTEFWGKGLGILAEIESGVKEDQRVQHNLLD